MTTHKKHLICITVLLTGLLVTFIVSGLIDRQTSDQLSRDRLMSQTDTAISAGLDKLSQNPKSVPVLVSLCEGYLQKVRETADTSYYAKCDSLLMKAISLEPMSADAIAAQASVAYGRHNFTTGLDLAQRALGINPNKPAYYGLVGDGQVELGQYAQAVASFQTMVDKRPDLSSFNRVAYIREIYGDVPGAKVALMSAIASGSSFPENVAYSQVELGKLQSRSNLDEAIKTYKGALEISTKYPPALEGLGKVEYAKGNYDKAIDYFNQAYSILPIAQYTTDLGDSYAAKGDANKASQQYYLTKLAFEESSKAGVTNDFEKAVFLTDHDTDLQAANSLLVKATQARPGIFTADALAWNLYKLKKYDEAALQSREAMKYGINQPVVLYHAAMIAHKLGKNEEAKTNLQLAISLDANFLESHFSLLDRKSGSDTLKRLE